MAFGYQPQASGSGIFNASLDGTDTDRWIGCNANGGEAYKILNGSSDGTQILLSTKDGSAFSFLFSARLPANLDFQTSMVAVGSYCQPLSRTCQLSLSKSMKSIDLIAVRRFKVALFVLIALLPHT